MTMTLVYARIADRTVTEQYFAVTEKVEALYQQQQPAVLAASDEPPAMRKLRAEHSSRMLGNGYCSRPVDPECHYETICESCTFFVTTMKFRLTLQAQRDDAAAKGQVGREKIYTGLLGRLDQTTAWHRSPKADAVLRMSLARPSSAIRRAGRAGDRAWSRTRRIGS